MAFEAMWGTARSAFAGLAAVDCPGFRAPFVVAGD